MPQNTNVNNNDEDYDEDLLATSEENDVEDYDEDFDEEPLADGQEDDEDEDFADYDGTDPDYDELAFLDEDIEWVNDDDDNDNVDDDEEYDSEDDGEQTTTSNSKRNLQDASNEELINIIKAANKESAARRIKNRELRESQTENIEQGINDFATRLAQTIGIDLDGETDIMEQLANGFKQSQASDKARELAIHKATIGLDVDPQALTDSISFNEALSVLDPTADDYEAQVAQAVEEQIKRNPSMKGTPVATRNGADFMAGQGTQNLKDDNDIDALQRKRRERRKNM